MGAPVPRRPDLHRILTRFNSRIRRLEVNAYGRVKTGVAAYAINLTDPTPAATWTPDWSTADQILDTIGCQAGSEGIYVPTEWMYWGQIGWGINTATAPDSGDLLIWSLITGASYGGAFAPGEYRAEPLYDTSGEGDPAQPLGGTIIGSTGQHTNQGVLTPEVETKLGSEFTPAGATIAITALQVYNVGLPDTVLTS